MAAKWEICFIGIGSNLGRKRENIRKSIAYLRNKDKIKIKKISALYLTNPEGYIKQPRFVNAVIKIETCLRPRELLADLNKIEDKLKRVRTFKNAPRTIDLDILLYADRLINRKDLKVPHPRMFEREFVLRPLAEILL